MWTDKNCARLGTVSSGSSGRSLPSKHTVLGSNPSPAKKEKKKKLARHQWLTPVILATQEADIRTKPAQPNSSKDPISKIKKPSRTQKKGLVDWF
jgi:hypothetical protein